MGNSSTARSFPDMQLFRDVFDASPIGIVVETLEGQPLFVNPAFCALLGFTEEELRNKHCVDFSPREDAERDWQLFQQLKQDLIDHYQLDKRYFRRDGSLVWGRLSISLLNSRPAPLVIAMVEDITDKKKGEEALRESEERLRLAVQAGRMFAYSWDVSSDLIERSGESNEILGAGENTAATGKAVKQRRGFALFGDGFSLARLCQKVNDKEFSEARHRSNPRHVCPSKCKTFFVAKLVSRKQGNACVGRQSVREIGFGLPLDYQIRLITSDVTTTLKSDEICLSFMWETA